MQTIASAFSEGVAYGAPLQSTAASSLDDVFRASIKARWWRWHKDNPHVYRLFTQFTLDVVNAGHSHYSSKAIFERIRWHTEIETSGEPFKMSNNYTAYYARLFMHEHPEYREFFRIKTLRRG